MFESANLKQTLLGQLEEIAVLRSRLDAREAGVVLELHRLDKATCATARISDLADELTHRASVSRSEARRRARRAGLFEDFPELHAAVADAQITGAHSDLIARIIPMEYRDELRADLKSILEMAMALSVDDFAKSLRRWLSDARRRRGEDPDEQRRAQRRLSIKPDRATGMLRMSGLLDPETGAVAKSALLEHERSYLREDQEAALADPSFESRSHGQRMADALEAVCRRSLNQDSTAGPGTGPSVVVGISLSDLISGDGEGTIHGAGPISVETARKLACEGEIIPAVLGTDRVILDMGRRSRLASREQRLALQTEYDGCAIAGCDAPFEWCHMHHIDYWSNGGRSDLHNLVPLCSRHHSLVHSGKIDLTPELARRRSERAKGLRAPPLQSARACQRESRSPTRSELRRSPV